MNWEIREFYTNSKAVNSLGPGWVHGAPGHEYDPIFYPHKLTYPKKPLYPKLCVGKLHTTSVLGSRTVLGKYIFYFLST